MNKLMLVSLSLSQESYKKLLLHVYLFLNSALIPIYTLYREGFCVLLTLLPGDSPGFDFGKPEWTNGLRVGTPAHQSAVGLCHVWVGWYSVFTMPIHQSFSAGGGGRVTLRAAVCPWTCMHSYMHVCVQIYVLYIHQNCSHLGTLLTQYWCLLCQLDAHSLPDNVYFFLWNHICCGCYQPHLCN